jgi:hypothetical protein
VVAGKTGEGTSLASDSLVGVAQPATVLARQVMAMQWKLFAWSSWSHSATVVAVTKVEGAAIATIRSVGVISASHCGGGHVR